MNYSFFGTCANDHDQFFGCLRTMIEQTLLPKQIILVDSGNANIEDEIKKYIYPKEIELIYIFKKVSRVKSLNMALDRSNAKYSFRFDSRARFSKNYAKVVLDIFNEKPLEVGVIGGTPEIISTSNKFESILCSEIMKRSYIFFYPKHRKPNYTGYASSIYLGCFRTNLLKQVRFCEKKDLISEDSLIINDIISKGFKAFISTNIKVSYICRDSLLNILKIFNTYGYCRANTILVTRKLFISLRHFYIFFILSCFIYLLSKISIFYLIILPVILFLFNLYGEINYFNKSLKIYIPFYATLCQFSWGIGFFWSLLSIFKKKSIKSNFIS